jgi:glycosyltransferase involved in cell wall biosynthesis
MRIIFVVQDPHIPYLFAGGPMDVHHMALTLAADGHEVAVAAALPGLPEAVKFRQFPYRFQQAISPNHLLVYRDTHNGYETFRVGHWLVRRLLEERIAAWRPDIVIAQGRNFWNFALTAVGQGVPVVLRQIDTYGPETIAQIVKTDSAIASLLHHELFTMVSNSAFVAAKVEELLKVASPVIYPLIRPEDSRCNNVDPRYITFISPIPLKGLAIALDVARLLPHRNFLFVEGWFGTAAQRKVLRREVARLRNVTLRPNSGTLGDVFASTAAILVPSQVEEAFGRVIVEAGFNGIPAVASRIGGIPESIGASGVLLEPSDPPQRWADALERIFSDPAAYASLCVAARVNAERKEFRAPVVTAKFLEVLHDHMHAVPV